MPPQGQPDNGQTQAAGAAAARPTRLGQRPPRAGALGLGLTLSRRGRAAQPPGLSPPQSHCRATCAHTAGGLLRTCQAAGLAGQSRLRCRGRHPSTHMCSTGQQLAAHPRSKAARVRTVAAMRAADCREAPRCRALRRQRLASVTASCRQARRRQSERRLPGACRTAECQPLSSQAGRAHLV